MHQILLSILTIFVRPDTKDLLNTVNELCTAQLIELEKHINEIENYLKSIANSDADCKLLMTIYGVKEFSSTVIMTSLSNIDNFADGHHYASSIGYAPRHRGTGGKNHNISAGPIGNKTVKKCYYFAAMVIYRQAKKIEEKEDCWLHRMIKEKTGKSAICAIANRLACTAYIMLKHKTPFDMERFKGKYQKDSKQQAS